MLEDAFMCTLHPCLVALVEDCLYGDVLSYIRIPPVCQDVQLRHWLEEHKWSVVYCFCCGFPCDSPDNLPKQVSFTHNQLFTFLQYKTGKLQKHFYSHDMITHRIIHTTLVLSMETFQPFAGYYFFNAMLMVLQALHVFWAGLILRMVYKLLKGNVRIGSRESWPRRVNLHSDF